MDSVCVCENMKFGTLKITLECFLLSTEVNSCVYSASVDDRRLKNSTPSTLSCTSDGINYYNTGTYRAAAQTRCLKRLESLIIIIAV